MHIDEIASRLNDINIGIAKLECFDKSISEKIDSIKSTFTDQEFRLKAMEKVIARLSYFREIGKYVIPVLCAAFFTGLFVNSETFSLAHTFKAILALYTSH